MTIDKELLAYILKTFGPWGVVVAIIIILVSKPDRAEKLKALVFMPLYKLCKCGSRAYLGSEISYRTTTFIRNHLTRYIPSIPDVKLKIKWVTSPKDPVLKMDGTLILRIRETNDQTRNVLSAARVALPRIVCATLRSNIEDYASSSIDLTILRDLTIKLGKHAYPLFQKYFLVPEVGNSEQVAELFAKLVEIDEARIFVSIYLEEINMLGDVLFASGTTEDVTGELMKFLEYLLGMARRELHEKIQLEFHSKHLDVGVLLLAISARAEAEGTVPYVHRINRYITLGCDSIYIVSFPVAGEFLSRILTVVDGDHRLTITKTIRFRLKRISTVEDGISSIVLVRRNTIHGDSTFSERLEVLNIYEGKRLEGTVLDVSRDKAVIDISGITATIKRTDCSWWSIENCNDVLEVEQSYEFLVKVIIKDKERIELTRRFPEDDSWHSEHLPVVGDSVTVQVMRISGNCYICSYLDIIEVKLLMHEVSWMKSRPDDPTSLIDTEQEVVVVRRNDDDHSLCCSIRQMNEDPWPLIHKRYVKGTELHGEVIEVTEHFVRLQLPEDMEGIVPKEAMQRAGFEYANFQQNVVLSQGMDVVVSKVFLKKRRIRLDLKRNVITNPN